MASEISICNLALSHLGDEATITSIDPPEGSAQAEHCAIFYPLARDSLLEMHSWKFSTRRANLAELTDNAFNWAKAYAEPNGALRILSVLEGMDSSEASTKPFETIANESGVPMILTDQPAATALYTVVVTDTTKYSPLFVMALSWHLASLLAGPILKGDVGAAEGKRCAQMMQMYLSKAMVSDAGQRRSTPQHNVGWISGR